MDRQIAHLPLQAVAILLGLGRRPLQGDAHIPQGTQPRLRVQVLLVLGRLSRGQLEHREGQHVGGPVNVPHVGVDLADTRVVGEQHADLAGQGHPLRRQGRGDDPPQALLQALGHSDLRVDQNLMVHDPLSLFDQAACVLPVIARSPSGATRQSVFCFKLL